MNDSVYNSSCSVILNSTIEIKAKIKMKNRSKAETLKANNFQFR